MRKYNLNRRIALSLMLIFSLLSQAQVHQWSNPVRLRGAEQFTKVLGENEHGVYLLRYRNKFLSKKILIDRYHHQLRLNYTKAIDLEKGRLVKIKLLKDKILLAYSSFDRKSQSNSLFMMYYDYELKPIGEPKKIVGLGIQEFGDRGDFRVRISDNEEFIGLIYTEKEGPYQLQYHWQILDKSLRQVTHYDQRIPIPRKFFQQQDFMLTDDGQIYGLVREIKEQRAGVREHEDWLLLHRQDTVLFQELTDSLELHNTGMTYDRANNELMVVGFYGEKQRYGSKGVMIHRIDVLSQRIHWTYTPFDSSITEEMNMGKHNAKILPEGFDFLKLVPRSDGGLLLVAEQMEIDTENDIVMVHGVPTSTSKNVYNFNEIIAMNISPTGDVEWQHVIHKNQTTVNDGGYFSSAVVYVNDHFIQLIYNDQIRNSGEVMQYTLYANGKMMSRKLLKSEVDYVVVIPFEANQVSSNKIIIPTAKNRRFALLKLVYE